MIAKDNISTIVGDFERFAIKTHFVTVGENFFDVFEKYVMPQVEEEDIVFCSEKIVALCQERVVRKQDMKLSVLAKILSKFASRPKGGIGVAEPYKMQFAIDQVGAIKVVFAAIAGGIGKLFGRKGIFYELVGNEVSGLDGFYDKVWKEYGDIGILIPENPNGVCNKISEKYGINMVIVDANDWGQELLGKCDSVPIDDNIILEIIRDNPAGQGKECTPFIIVRKIK